MPVDPARPRFTALPPLSLYVHIPWCVRKCPYCDFNSHEARGDAARGRVRRRAARRSRVGAAGDLGPQGRDGLHRRRHAEPVLRGGDRPPARRHPRAPAARARRRDHAGSQSRHVRARASSPASAPPASTGCRSASRASTTRICRRSAASTTRARRARAVEAALAIFDNVNLDLMYALPRADARARRAADVAAALAFAPPHLSVLPPDARAEHAVPSPSAAAARRRRRGRHGGRRARGAGAAPATGTTRPRPSRSPGANAGTTSTTGSSAITSASAPARIRSCRCRTASLRQVRWKQPKQYLEQVGARRSRCRRRRRSPRDDIGFEFMLNALRLTDGVPPRRSPSAPAIRSRSSSGTGRSGAPRSASTPIRRRSARRRSGGGSSTTCRRCSCATAAARRRPRRWSGGSPPRRWSAGIEAFQPRRRSAVRHARPLILDSRECPDPMKRARRNLLKPRNPSRRRRCCAKAARTARPRRRKRRQAKVALARLQRDPEAVE